MSDQTPSDEQTSGSQDADPGLEGGQAGETNAVPADEPISEATHAGDAPEEPAPSDSDPQRAGRTSEESPRDGGASPDADTGTTVETHYEASSAGHRITRRQVRRKTRTETVEEDIVETATEEIPIVYQAPAVASHPAPVG